MFILANWAYNEYQGLSMLSSNRELSSPGTAITACCLGGIERGERRKYEGRTLIREKYCEGHSLQKQFVLGLCLDLILAVGLMIVYRMSPRWDLPFVGHKVLEVAAYNYIMFPTFVIPLFLLGRRMFAFDLEIKRYNKNGGEPPVFCNARCCTVAIACCPCCACLPNACCPSPDNAEVREASHDLREAKDILCCRDAAENPGRQFDNQFLPGCCQPD